MTTLSRRAFLAALAAAPVAASNVGPEKFLRGMALGIDTASGTDRTVATLTILDKLNAYTMEYIVPEMTDAIYGRQRLLLDRLGQGGGTEGWYDATL